MNESRENYLKAILMLQREKGYVHQVDIAEAMGVSKPSVCLAMKKLKEQGLLELDGDSAPVLTPAGREMAEDVCERHKLFTEMLVALGVQEEQASVDACRMEHVLSEESFRALQERFHKCVELCAFRNACNILPVSNF